MSEIHLFPMGYLDHIIYIKRIQTEVVSVVYSCKLSVGA